MFLLPFLRTELEDERLFMQTKGISVKYCYKFLNLCFSFDHPSTSQMWHFKMKLNFMCNHTINIFNDLYQYLLHSVGKLRWGSGPE